MTLFYWILLAGFWLFVLAWLWFMVRPTVSRDPVVRAKYDLFIQKRIQKSHEKEIQWLREKLALLRRGDVSRPLDQVLIRDLEAELEQAEERERYSADSVAKAGVVVHALKEAKKRA